MVGDDPVLARDDLTLTAQRALYNQFCDKAEAEFPKSVRFEDRLTGDVRCRAYFPKSLMKSQVIVYFHGGGWVLGDLDSHHVFCGEIAQRFGARVLSVHYSLAPEQKFPVAFEDCVSAVDALLDAGENLILMGDSAGGNLAAALSVHYRGNPQIKGQALLYPALGSDMSRRSFTELANAPMLSAADIAVFSGAYFGEPVPTDDWRAFPLAAPDLKHVAPAVIVGAEFDPLLDDASDYADRLEDADIEVSYMQAAGMVHGFLRARHTSPEARQAVDRFFAAVALL